MHFVVDGGINIVGEAIKCKKWVCQTDGTYRCVQVDKALCGCKSFIEYPLSVTDILNDEQKREREKSIADMEKSIRKDQAALVLGAGISRRSGMPSWSGLISKMMGYAIQYDQLNGKGAGVMKTSSDENIRLLELAQELINRKLNLLGNVNMLESAEYVAQLFDTAAMDPALRRSMEGQAISAMVRHMVDHSTPPKDLLLDQKTSFWGEIGEVNRYRSMPAAQIVKELGETRVAQSESMFAVSYLLSHTNGIRRAMTYNYDPLVQEYMMELYGSGELDILTHPGSWGSGLPKGDTREIYHVHGFVPGKRHLEKKDERVFPKESGPIILSEDSYYRIEQEEAYNWSSSIQSYFLNRYQCIFVGFSAEDYNFRRILRQIGKNNAIKPHFLILSIRKWISDTYEDVCHAYIKQFKDTPGKAETERISQDTILLLRYILECRAAYWRRFNIYPIWVTSKEIPQLLTGLLSI